MKYTKRILIITLVICINFVFCGFMFSKPSIDINTDKFKVYKVYSIEDILKNGAEDNYKLCCVGGKITEISNNNKKIYISNGTKESEILLDTNKVVNQAETLNVEDYIQVYGTVKKDIFSNEYHIEVSTLSTTKTALTTGDTYCLESGATINKSDMVECSLNDGKIKYFVPKSWKSEDIEIDIIENDLGYVEGKQYVLNKINGSDVNIPESFFVCYFKYDGNLQKSTDKSKVKPIEKAIAESIEDSTIIKFPSYEKKTYYGSKYQYYQGNYNDKIQVNKDYYTEYIFEQDGEDGIIMYLYLFRKPAHIDDIMFVTRFLQKG